MQLAPTNHACHTSKVSLLEQDIAPSSRLPHFSNVLGILDLLSMFSVPDYGDSKGYFPCGGVLLGFHLGGFRDGDGLFEAEHVVERVVVATDLSIQGDVVLAALGRTSEYPFLFIVNRFAYFACSIFFYFFFLSRDEI